MIINNLIFLPLKREILEKKNYLLQSAGLHLLIIMLIYYGLPSLFRYRSDFFLERELNLNKYIDSCNDTIFTPGWFGDERDAANGNFGIHDWWAFSSSENMDYYSSLFPAFGETLKKCKVIRPETLLYYYLKYNENIKYSQIDSRTYLDSDNAGKKYSR